MKNNRPTTRAPRSLTSLILGSSLFLGGLQQSCTTPGEQLARGEITREEYEARIERQGAELTSLLGGVVSGLGAQRGDPGAVMFGQAISGLGAASAGRSDVRQNVNVYQPGTENQTRQNSQPGNQTGQNSGKRYIRYKTTLEEIYRRSPEYQRERGGKATEIIKLGRAVDTDRDGAYDISSGEISLNDHSYFTRDSTIIFQFNKEILFGRTVYLCVKNEGEKIHTIYFQYLEGKSASYKEKQDFPYDYYKENIEDLVDSFKINGFTKTHGMRVYDLEFCLDSVEEPPICTKRIIINHDSTR